PSHATVATPAQAHHEAAFDAPDTIVVPLSLDRFAEIKTPEPAPALAPEPAPTVAPEPAPRAAPRPLAPSEDPMRKREHTLKKAAMVGAAFSIGIVLANMVAQRYQFDVFEDNTEPFYPRVAAVRPHHNVAPPQEAAPARITEPSQRTPASTVLPLPVVAETPKGPSPMDLRAFAQAIEEGKLAEVTRLVDSGVVSADFALDDLGRSPFLRAAAAGRITVMQYLISKKVAVAAADYNGNTALMWATINGHEKTVKFLLSIGADPKIKREDGKNSLQLAQQYRQPLVLKLLKSVAAAPAPSARKPASK
ncbi:MAG: ankyrin repeat domain-containing protein, partial [Bdellovibrionota bacterium]